MRLTRDLIARIPRNDHDPGPTHLYLTDEERTRSLAATMADRRAPKTVWVFAYGSLIWKPAFSAVESRIGTLHGYHRQFCMLVKRYRGTPEEPGLMLALERGGSCRGMAYRVAEDGREQTLTTIWTRELLTAAYLPRWLDVRTDGGTVRAIAFVMNRAHERYTGRLDEADVADRLARACGHVGSCAEYLLETVTHLEELGIRDHRLWRLQRLVAARLAAR